MENVNPNVATLSNVKTLNWPVTKPNNKLPKSRTQKLKVKKWKQYSRQILTKESGLTLVFSDKILWDKKHY